REMCGAGPGWTFLTGKPADIESLRKAVGFTYPDPAIDKDKTQHIGNVRYGNEPLMLWAACPGMAHASFIAASISWMVHPENNRVHTPLTYESRGCAALGGSRDDEHAKSGPRVWLDAGGAPVDIGSNSPAGRPVRQFQPPALRLQRCLLHGQRHRRAPARYA